MKKKKKKKQFSFRTRDGFELHEQVLCSNSHELNPYALLELPCGRTLYIEHIELRNGNVLLKLHTQDTDLDYMSLESKDVSNGITLKLSYFDYDGDGELPVKEQVENDG